MGMSIEGKLAIVTGGAQGIGYIIVRNLLLKGAQAVAIIDMDVVAGNKATDEFIAEFGADRVIFFSADISVSDKFHASFTNAVQKLGGLDIMINNAGVGGEDNWNNIIDVNYRAAIHGSLMAIDVMGKHKGGNGGTIINIGSIASFITTKYAPIYCSTKSGIVHFSRAIALSYGETGVAIKAMCPGPTDTPVIKDITYPPDLPFIDRDAALLWLRNMKLQQPDIIADEVIRLIEEASNGDIWSNTVETSTLSLKIPDYKTWGKFI